MYFQFGPTLKKGTKSLSLIFSTKSKKLMDNDVDLVFWGWDQIQNTFWDYPTFTFKGSSDTMITYRNWVSPFFIVQYSPTLGLIFLASSVSLKSKGTKASESSFWTEISASESSFWTEIWPVQVNLCQKHLFSHQLTHNMTRDCSLIYQFCTWKLKAQSMLFT